MKIRIIQENNVVIVTLLSLSEKITSKFKKRVVTLVNDTDEYLEIWLCIKKYDGKLNISSHSLGIGINSVNTSSCYEFLNVEYAERFVRRLKKSINLINHGTEDKIAINSLIYRDTIVEILE